MWLLKYLKNVDCIEIIVEKGEIAHFEIQMLLNRKKKKSGEQGSYSPTILQNVLSLVLQIFLYLAGFECNTNSDMLNHAVYLIRIFFTFKFTKSCRNRQSTYLRMAGEYGLVVFFHGQEMSFSSSTLYPTTKS